MNLRWRVAQYFEIRWWQRYLGSREKTAYLAWKSRYWRDFLQKSALEVPPGVAVLDAGCGPAGIFTVMKDQTVDALDPLLERYEKSLPHFRRSDYPRIRFYNMALENFFPETSYDFVFCLNALNHVADLPQCLDRLAALTRPGGVLALSVDAHRISRLKKFFRLVPVDILHPHQYDLAEYSAMLAARNFRIVRAAPIKESAIFNHYLLVAEKS